MSTTKLYASVNDLTGRKKQSLKIDWLIDFNCILTLREIFYVIGWAQTDTTTTLSKKDLID